MAGYNPSDIAFRIVKEVTEGVTPTSPAFLKMDHIPGTSPMYTSDFIDSPVLSASRASGGKRKTNYRNEGGLNVHFCRDAAVELLLQSALSGQWVETGDVGVDDDVLKASNVDTSFTIEKIVGGSPTLYSRFTGCQVSKFNLKCEASGNAEASFEIIGMGRTTAVTALSGATYAEAKQSLKLAGLDVTDVTIGGLSGLNFRSLELSVEHDREARDCFGQASAMGVGTSGSRDVKLVLQFYRTNWTPETVLAGDGSVPVSFKIGTNSDGYTFNIPAAQAASPTDDEDGSKLLVTVEFSAKYDPTNLTDLIVTRN